MNDLSSWLNFDGASPQTLLAGVAALTVAWGVLKGVARLALLALSLAAGAAAAAAVYRYAPGAFISWLGAFSPNALNWAAAIAGVLAMWFSRRFLNALVSGRVLWRPASGAGNGLLCLLPAVLVAWMVAMALNWIGGVSRMRLTEEAVKANAPALLEKPPLAAKLRAGLARGEAGQWLDRVDPLHASRVSALGALLTVAHDTKRAWPRLLKNPKITPALGDTLRRLLKDKEVQYTLSYGHYSQFMTLPQVREAAKSQAVREAMRGLNVEEVVRSALSNTPAPAGTPAKRAGSSAPAKR